MLPVWYDADSNTRIALPGQTVDTYAVFRTGTLPSGRTSRYLMAVCDIRDDAETIVRALNSEVH